MLALHEAGLPLAGSLANFCTKYGDAGKFLALRSLVWFADAEDEPDPMFLNGWTWDFVRQRITILGQELIRSASSGERDSRA